MISKRLTGILKTFSHEETKEFEKFLLSPFFTTNKNFSKFHKELLKFRPDYKSDLLSSEYIFGRMFTGKQYNKQVMWNLTSGLEKLAEEFLTQLSLIKKPINKFNPVFEELELRKLDKHYLKMLKEMEEKLENCRINADNLIYLADLEENKTSYWQKIKGLPGKAAENDFNMAQIYTLNYLMNISRIIETLNIDKSNYGFKKQFNMAEDFVRYANFEGFIETSKQNKYKYADLIEFYINLIYCSLNRDREEHYYKVKDFLFENHEVFDINEKKNIATSIANYCVQKFQLGSTKFLRELFEINKFRLENGIVTFKSGKINKDLYKQVVFVSTSLNETEWTEKFVEEYTPLLFAEYRESMKNFAKALVYYSEKKFDDVLNCLKRFRFADVMDKVNVKILIAKTHFEMREFEMLFYHIDTSRHFLKNNKNVSSFLCDTNCNFLNYLQSIVSAIEKSDSAKLKKLEEKIRKDNTVAGKSWLLEKLLELEKVQ